MRQIVFLCFSLLLLSVACNPTPSSPQASGSSSPTPQPTPTAIVLSAFAQAFKDECPATFSSVTLPSPITTDGLCSCIAIKLDAKVKADPTLLDVWRTDKTKEAEFSKSTATVCLTELSGK